MSAEYQQLMQGLLTGWNTYDTRSVLCHVKMPEGFALRLGIKEYQSGQHLTRALIGRQGYEVEQILPGAHAYDGSFTSLVIRWRGIEAEISTAKAGEDYVWLITPIKNQRKPALLTMEAVMLWNRPGLLQRGENSLCCTLPGGKVELFSTAENVQDAYLDVTGPCLAAEMTAPIGISSGKRRSLADIEAIIAEGRQKLEKEAEKYAPHAECWQAMQSCLAWDTIYDPGKNRVIAPVSRIWSCDSGGYVLFCWDTYFASAMMALDHRELAFANAVEITKESEGIGFVPNFVYATGVTSRDRSQPPVGSMTFWDIYSRYKEKWLLAEGFDLLCRWNDWFWQNRRLPSGCMTWGSDPYPSYADNRWETEAVNERYGAALESGLDNSPMYDDIPFDRESHLLQMADVGLTALYLQDCRCLALIARELGQEEKAQELDMRRQKMEDALMTLWDEESGMFLNRLVDGSFSRRMSPTNFYALFAAGVTEAQVSRMIREHFMNPEEFYGEWIMPSIARNDPAYPEQNYWRGRIWAPMNYLVYRALCTRGEEAAVEARRILAEKSEKLILKEWRSHRHVHENYCADTGEGCNVGNSDRFYHWGGLLSLIALMEAQHG